MNSLSLVGERGYSLYLYSLSSKGEGWGEVSAPEGLCEVSTPENLAEVSAPEDLDEL